jgi:hypothetical protein
MHKVRLENLSGTRQGSSCHTSQAISMLVSQRQLDNDFDDRIRDRIERQSACSQNGLETPEQREERIRAHQVAYDAFWSKQRKKRKPRR